MRTLYRWGGVAGVLAAAALVWVAVAVGVVMPAAGLGPPGPYPHYNPDSLLPFIRQRPVLFGLLNVGGGAVAALLALAFVTALGERLREAGAAGRFGRTLAVVGTAALALEALLWQGGVAALARLQTTDPVAARHAFFALAGVIGSVDLLGTAAVGLGVLLLGSAMRSLPSYAGAGTVGMLGGALLVASRIVPGRLLVGLSALLAVVWLVWSGLLLRRETSRAP
ncbi:MAG: hypothetical protein QN173_02180 [Armatimonadota bacterium]|nr:hypothetical protein [Armatimonadota bacterium]MDR7402167.1 hypothetical protein [Armatimonadota bacterium]MDR7404664.1 hypothetical protein [Armatimonadota bacterium]MDR7436924.1 hypothetical protein [Armatimonadota bacterium]MDR7472302.1 hypothetical protein [Armatimonadota bacterium]